MPVKETAFEKLKRKNGFDPDKAVKFDGDKPGVDLLPFDALLEITKVYDFGARKYSARNWENGMAWSRLFAACMRHLWAWFQGENKDPESGLSHLVHAAFCILCLVAYEKRKAGTDDRPKAREIA